MQNSVSGTPDKNLTLRGRELYRLKMQKRLFTVGIEDKGNEKELPRVQGTSVQRENQDFE